MNGKQHSVLSSMMGAGALSAQEIVLKNCAENYGEKSYGKVSEEAS